MRFFPEAVYLVIVSVRNSSGGPGYRRGWPADPVGGNTVSSGRLRRMLRILTGVVLVALLVGGLTFVGVRSTQHRDTLPAQSTQPSPPAPPRPTSIGVAIAGCYNRSVPPSDRPIKLNIVGCASTAVALQDISWTSWGPRGADGTGTAVFKICQPTCASGYQLTNQVVIHAWNPQPPRANSGCPVGLKIFADMILAFPKGAPPASAQEMNTQYQEMPAVHYTNYSVASPRDGQFIGYTFCD